MTNDIYIIDDKKFTDYNDVNENQIVPIIKNSEFTDNGGDKNFVFTQNTPTLLWTINHGLNKNVSVTIVNDRNTEIEAEVIHIDINIIEIKFSHSFSGKAYIN